LDTEGYLQITGRLKDLFKTSKGKYVAPAPIEKKLLEHPLFSQVCVVGSGQSHALALCLLATPLPIDRAHVAQQLNWIRKKVNEQIESHEQLAKLIVVQEEWAIANGFLTPTLKIKRNVIDAQYSARYAEWLLASEDTLWE
jgi:long-chain acyl-CoA synthetase